jgi:epoxyqueuosine reductase
MSLTQEIKAKALELGFSKVGISPAGRLDERNGLDAWLAAGRAGEMEWMTRHPDKRIDPAKVLPKVQSVIALALNYFTPFSHSEDANHGKISRYAWGCDYHQVMNNHLKPLWEWILGRVPLVEGLYYSDTGPLMDKAWAHQSGLGWIGKHSNVITRDRGSWVFLGEILISLKLDYDVESRNYCGSCRRCLDCCPTKAIVAPYVVDARLCISYLTIELRGPIPRELRSMIGSRIFGCDDCQDICPWNRFATPSTEMDFYPNRGTPVPVLLDLMEMTESEFKDRFRHSPVRRARYAGFLRNVAVALGNSHDLSACGVLERSLKHAEPLVRSHAAWALAEIGNPISLPTLIRAASAESDSLVLDEFQIAISSLQSRPSFTSNYSSP